MKRLLIILLSLVSFGAYANGEHYITSSAELKALEKSGEIEAGDVVVWRNGSYADQIISLTTDGVTLKAESLGGVKFEGQSRIVVNAKEVVLSGFVWNNSTAEDKKTIIMLGKESADCCVEDCVIDGFGSELDMVNNDKWVSLYGTRNTIRHCSFIDKKSMGTTLVVWFEKGVVPNHTIECNYFSRPNANLGPDGKGGVNGQETIRIGTGAFKTQTGGCKVVGNHFDRCSGETEIISNKTCYNHYENNLFSDCQGCLTIRQGVGCVVTKNYFTNDLGVKKSGGVRTIGEQHSVVGNYMENLLGDGFCAALCTVRGNDTGLYPQVKDVLFSKNVIVNCAYGMVMNFAARDTSVVPVVDTKVVGNTILSADDAVAVEQIELGSPEVEYSKNVIYGGEQRGVKLPTTKRKPRISRPTAAINAIASNAGVRYTR